MLLDLFSRHCDLLLVHMRLNRHHKQVAKETKHRLFKGANLGRINDALSMASNTGCSVLGHIPRYVPTGGWAAASHGWSEFSFKLVLGRIKIKLN